MSEMTPVEASRTTSVPVPPALGETAAEAHRRVDLYDGLRGIAIVLVVLSHGWYLWPIDWVDQHAWVRPFFRSGNSGVTIFLVAAGFLMFRSLTARRPLFAMRADTTFVRRVARVGPSLWLFLVVAVVVAALDSSTEAWNADTGASVFHVATYTWNWYLQSHVLVSRPDFGHLWYLSVDMQAFVIMACLCYLLRRHRVGLMVAAAGLYLLLVWWRFHVLPSELIFQVLLRTTVRMDPFVVGVLTAAALPYLVRLRLSSRAVGLTASASLLLLVPLLDLVRRQPVLPPVGRHRAGVGCRPLLRRRRPGGDLGFVTAVTGTRLATWLGRNSLLLYIWHFPIFVFVARHTVGDGWSWEARTVVALTATVVICILADRLLERRVQGVDNGDPPGATSTTAYPTGCGCAHHRSSLSYVCGRGGTMPTRPTMVQRPTDDARTPISGRPSLVADGHVAGAVEGDPQSRVASRAGDVDRAGCDPPRPRRRHHAVTHQLRGHHGAAAGDSHLGTVTGPHRHDRRPGPFDGRRGIPDRRGSSPSAPRPSSPSARRALGPQPRPA